MPEDPLNACLLAVRTLEVELKNSLDRTNGHGREIAELDREINTLRRDLAIARNELSGLITIKNYLIAACVAQFVTTIVAIPSLMIQVQHLNAQNSAHTTKTK